jgi:hypothetical protein
MKRTHFCVGWNSYYNGFGTVNLFLQTGTRCNVCPKIPVLDKNFLVADKKASFLRPAKLEKCEFTGVNGHFESERKKNGVFLLKLSVNFDRLAEFIFFFG